MNDVQAFEGFSEQGLRFLGELAKHNDRTWFQPRKDEYGALLVEPAQRFVAELGQRMLRFAPGLAYDTQTSGSGSILRVYRDTRFSKDKRPYHTHLRMVLWEGPRKKMENPSFWIGISPEGAGLYAGIHMFNKSLMAAYRAAVNEDAGGEALSMAIAAVEASAHYRVGEEHYKRVPRGFPADHPRAGLLRYNGLHISLPPVGPEIVTTPELVEVCAERFEHTVPVHKWLVDLIARVEE